MNFRVFLSAIVGDCYRFSTLSTPQKCPSVDDRITSGSFFRPRETKEQITENLRKEEINYQNLQSKFQIVGRIFEIKAPFLVVYFGIKQFGKSAGKAKRSGKKMRKPPTDGQKRPTAFFFYHRSIYISLLLSAFLSKIYYFPPVPVFTSIDPF